MPIVIAQSLRVAVVGGGPAGLMAAEVLAAGGAQVDLYDSMPSVGRKFLLAGRGGLNLTHSEPAAQFRARYGAGSSVVSTWLDCLDAEALRAWVHGLGIATFVGSSGRVFPQEMKAAPLLRAWLARLRAAGVRFHMRHRWLGWDDPPPAQRHRLIFDTPAGHHCADAQAVILALGGGSWARLGSDGTWVDVLARQGVPVLPLQPANCGFDVAWSAHFSGRHAGQPIKSVAMACHDHAGTRVVRQGEFVITAGGIEGSLVYALSAWVRDAIGARGQADIELDLMPGWTVPRIVDAVAHPRGARSMSSHLQSRLKLAGTKAALLRECASPHDYTDPQRLAARIKRLPVRVLRPRPLDEAISSAGGISLTALTPGLMLRHQPGVYGAGEMLDWEAPTGGYLLTACMASGMVAARSVLAAA